MQFTKMHGAGNDYIYVDCFRQSVPSDIPNVARRMSDRHFGVGGDGLVLIFPSERADAEMRMFNADGSAAEMCGNAIRCVAKYLYDHGICSSNPMTIESAGRAFTLALTIEDSRVQQVRVDMGEPILVPAEIPTTLRGSAPDEPVLDVELSVPAQEYPVAAAPRRFRVTCVSMGNPHCVTYVDQLSEEWVLGVGPQVEVDGHFPNRTNVEFVKVLSRQEVQQRTWERGSGETLACGTGASAVCVAGVLTGRTDRRVNIHLPGGDLLLEWNEADNHVYMTGPAVEVFAGEWLDEDESKSANYRTV